MSDNPNGGVFARLARRIEHITIPDWSDDGLEKLFDWLLRPYVTPEALNVHKHDP